MKIQGIITTIASILAIIAVSTTAAAALSCDDGDICANETGWWRDGGTFTASGAPIQAAVSNANVGETICVAAGSYTDNVGIPKQLTLRGAGADVVTVTAADSDDYVFSMTADYVNISGFTATGATGSGKAGIYLINRQHCNISENYCSNNYWGIWLHDSSDYNTLLNNTAHSNSHYGIYLLYADNNTLLGNTAHSNDDYGIKLSYSNNNTLSGNTVHLNYHGAYLWSSSGNTLSNNTASSNSGYGIDLCGAWNNTFVDNNLISNRYGIVMYTSCKDNMLIRNSCSNNTYYGISLLGLNNTCVDNNCSNNYLGIDVYSTSNSTVSGNLVSNNSCGIDISYSDNNTFENNIASSNDYRGIEMTYSNNNTLRNNTANSNNGGGGIQLRSSSNYNTLLGNDFSDNIYGIYMTASSSNTLSGNTANSNRDYGIYLYSSSDNNLIYNNYLSNTANARDYCNNQWNITKTNGTNIIGGPFLGGNYWSDYAGVDNTGDGLGDTMLPYTSSGDITNGGDYHPLALAAVIPCDSDICVNQSGWWRDGGAFNANTTPIQAAVDNATSGETIYVWNGSYAENVDVDKRLTLRGEGADLVTVTAADSSDHVFYVTADYVNISGFTVTGAGYSYTGIYLNGADHCNSSENNASNNYHGICLYSSSNNTLLNNTADSNNGFGIYMDYSSNYNTLSGNTMSGNTYNFGVSGSSLSEYIQNIDTSNTVDGKPIYYWINQKDRQIPGDAGFVGIVNGTNITVRDLILTNSRDGVLFAYTENSRIENVTANLNSNRGIYLHYSSNNLLDSNTASLNNYCGIYLDSSCNYNTLLNNTASSNNWDGIRLDRSSNYNTLSGNTANSNNEGGIHLRYSSNHNTLSGNAASNNCRGIQLYDSSDNTLQDNNASNSDYGIYLQYSSDNDVTCNLLQNNIVCGMYLASGSTGNNITWNNIVANGELQTDGSYHYQFKNSQSSGVDAINNFWGAGMNESTIDASIYDDEEGQAEVTFYPFEIEPVPCAPAPIPDELPAFTITDAMIALEIAVGSRPLDLRYDVNGDGQVTSLDALMIAREVRT